MLGKALTTAAAGNAAGEATYVEDVFSTHLYEGNGSTQAITNGVDLDGEGGLVWIKNRGAGGHLLSDSARSSIGHYLVTNSANAEAFPNNFINSYNSNGFTLGTWVANTSGDNYVSWTFRKAPKFFDMVTWTGDGTGARTISHNLGATVGALFMKATNAEMQWFSFHNGLTNQQFLELNATTQAVSSVNTWNNTTPTSTQFSVGSYGNISGRNYVAYLFAHNDGDGEFGVDADQDIIKCGSFTTDGSYNASVDLGFEPQWILIKRSDGSANWNLFDSMRGMPAPGLSPTYTGLQNLFPNLSNAEGEANGPHPTATGFEVTSYGAANANYIYIAIRRGPMKTPESGTEVFAPSLTNKNTTGFPVDAFILKNTAGGDNAFYSRLTGGTRFLETNQTLAELTSSDYGFDDMEGTALDGWGTSFIFWNFRRAPGFFDVVAYTGTSSATTVSHNLGVTPELILFKSRTLGRDWVVYSKTLTSAYKLSLNEADAGTTVASSYFNGTEPTSTNFTVATNASINQSGATYIAYLFATVPGVSKVGSYTGNGTSQTIDCGFSAGARFVLIKRTDSTGDWHVYDSERGIVAGNDPRLELNTTNAEDTGSDDIDPVSSGFSVTSNADVNTNSAEYIFLAIA